MSSVLYELVFTTGDFHSLQVDLSFEIMLKSIFQPKVSNQAFLHNFYHVLLGFENRGNGLSLEKEKQIKAIQFIDLPNNI